MINLFFNYDMKPGEQEQILSMPIEQIQEQIQEDFRPGNGSYITIQQRIDSPEYAKMYNINYTQKPCDNNPTI